MKEDERDKEEEKRKEIDNGEHNTGDRTGSRKGRRDAGSTLLWGGFEGCYSLHDRNENANATDVGQLMILSLNILNSFYVADGWKGFGAVLTPVPRRIAD